MGVPETYQKITPRQHAEEVVGWIEKAKDSGRALDLTAFEIGLTVKFGKLESAASEHIEILERALRQIDALAYRHATGAIGKAQRIARAALAFRRMP